MPSRVWPGGKTPKFVRSSFGASIKGIESDRSVFVSGFLGIPSPAFLRMHDDDVDADERGEPTAALTYRFTCGRFQTRSLLFALPTPTDQGLLFGRSISISNTQPWSRQVNHTGQKEESNHGCGSVEMNDNSLSNIYLPFSFYHRRCYRFSITAKEHVRPQQYAKGPCEWYQEGQAPEIREHQGNGPQVPPKPKVCQKVQRQ
jgi:hypothetical protein